MTLCICVFNSLTFLPNVHLQGEQQALREGFCHCSYRPFPRPCWHLEAQSVGDRPSWEVWLASWAKWVGCEFVKSVSKLTGNRRKIKYPQMHCLHVVVSPNISRCMPTPTDDNDIYIFRFKNKKNGVCEGDRGANKDERMEQNRQNRHVYGVYQLCVCVRCFISCVSTHTHTHLPVFDHTMNKLSTYPCCAVQEDCARRCLRPLLST